MLVERRKRNQRRAVPKAKCLNVSTTETGLSLRNSHVHCLADDEDEDVKENFHDDDDESDFKRPVKREAKVPIARAKRGAAVTARQKAALVASDDDDDDDD